MEIFPRCNRRFEGFSIEQMPGGLPDVQAMIAELDLGQCQPGG